MNRILLVIMIVLGLTAPFFAYPVFVMDLLCFALFACAFNLLLGYAGLLSFGHAAFLAAPPTLPVTRSRNGASLRCWVS